MEGKANPVNMESLPEGKFGPDGATREVEEVLENMPTESRAVIERFIALSQVRYSETSADLVMAEKITQDHITEILAGSRENMQLAYKERGRKRLCTIIVIGMAIAAVIAIIVLLKSNPSTMEKIISVLISSVLGGLGGFGLGRSQKKDE